MVGVMATFPRSNSAISLVEILIVVTVIGLLSALILPLMSKFREEARVVGCQNRQQGLTQAMLLFADDQRGYFLCARGGGGPGFGNVYKGWSWPSDLAPFVDSALTVADGGYGGWGSLSHFERTRKQYWAANRCPGWQGREDIEGPAAPMNAPPYDGGGFGINYAPDAPESLAHTVLDWGNWGTSRKIFRLRSISLPTRRAWLADNNNFLIGMGGNAISTFQDGWFDAPVTWRANVASSNGGARHGRNRIVMAFFDGHVGVHRLTGLRGEPITGPEDPRLAFMNPGQFCP